MGLQHGRHGVGDDLLHGGLELGQHDLRLDEQAAEHLFARVARDRARLSQYSQRNLGRVTTVSGP